MADMMNPKKRSKATDFSSVNKADFMGGVAPAAAPVASRRPRPAQSLGRRPVQAQPLHFASGRPTNPAPGR